MNTLQERDPFFVESQTEHRILRDKVAELVSVLEEPLGAAALPRRQAVMTSGIAELLDLLKRHFRQEESGGCMEEALTRAPRLCAQARAIEREHAGLLARLTALLDRLRDAPATDDVWRQLDLDLRGYFSDLLAHEAAEDRLLRDAFGVGE
jgi:hypothetical protein